MYGKDPLNKLYAIILTLILHSGVTLASPEPVVASDEPVSGILQNQYVNMWWQWAVSMSEKESPVKDRTGAKCNVNQTGPVWYLAGGYGNSKISRKCSIPSDKFLFFPVINMVYYPRNGNRVTTCKTVKERAAINNQYLRSFKVKIDEHKYLNPVLYRNHSNKCFDLIARKANVAEHQMAYPSATDGYWIMLKPLSVGAHKISFRAEYNRPDSSLGTMVQDIEYEITVFDP